MALVDGDRSKRAKPREQLAGQHVEDEATSRALQAIHGAIRRLESRFDDLTIFTGNGSPEGEVAAPIGAVWLRRDDTSGYKLYVKETDPGAKTGWVGK